MPADVVNAVSAFSQLLLAVTAITAAHQGLKVYWKDRRLERMKWLQELYRAFYVDGSFLSVRENLDFDYVNWAPVISRAVAGAGTFSAVERDFLMKLDAFLNFLEYVAYLENQKQISRKGRHTMFNYWFNFLKQNKELWAYINKFDYENLSRVGSR